MTEHEQNQPREWGAARPTPLGQAEIGQFALRESLGASLGRPESERPVEARYGERMYDNPDAVRTVTELKPGLYLERPTDEIIEALQEADSRIDPVHIADPDDPLALERALAAKLDADFADEEVVAIRSIQASLDGTVSGRSLEVLDIRDILNNGDIHRREAVNLAGFKVGEVDTDGADRIPHRVVDFASDTELFREDAMGGAEGADRIFPVILVYDHSRMERVEKYGYKLPEADTDRASIIQKAYVLDAVTRPLP